MLAPLGRLPNAALIVALTALAGMTEGLGLAVFAPLTAILTGESYALPAPFSRIVPLLQSAGIDADPAILLAVAALCVLMSLALILVQSTIITRSQQRFAHELRRNLFTALLEARWSKLVGQMSGDVLSNLIQAAEQSGDGMRQYGLFVGGCVLLLLYVALGALISGELLLLSCVVGVILVFATKPMLGRSVRLGRRATEAERDYTIQAVDRIRGAKLIKITGTESDACRTVVGYGEVVSRTKIQTQVNAHILNFLLQSGPVLLIAATIGIGALVLELRTSLLVVFLLVMMRVAPRVANTQLMLQGFLMNSPALARVDGRIAELRGAHEETNEDGVWFEKLTAGIVLDRVGYHHEGASAAAVHDVSVAIGRNEMVAFVGPSGAGKSTLVEMIAGIRTPDSGRVLVDGVDIARINLRSLRRRIGYVTQDNILFNDTVRANLLFAHKTASQADIDRTLRVAHVEELIAGLPQGLDTIVGEGGVRFSGGERQRIALARALVGDPEILLLDEATSNLDNESELYIQRAIEEIAHKMTVIVIAHRLSTVRRADMIHVMDGGRIVESGRYEELVARGGRFSALYRAQFA